MNTSVADDSLRAGGIQLLQGRICAARPFLHLGRVAAAPVPFEDVAELEVNVQFDRVTLPLPANVAVPPEPAERPRHPGASAFRARHMTGTQAGHGQGCTRTGAGHTS